MLEKTRRHRHYELELLLRIISFIHPFSQFRILIQFHSYVCILNEKLKQIIGQRSLPLSSTSLLEYASKYRESVEWVIDEKS